VRTAATQGIGSPQSGLIVLSAVYPVAGTEHADQRGADE